jgi:hypothetical protein
MQIQETINLCSSVAVAVLGTAYVVLKSATASVKQFNALLREFGKLRQTAKRISPQQGKSISDSAKVRRKRDWVFYLLLLSATVNLSVEFFDSSPISRAAAVQISAKAGFFVLLIADHFARRRFEIFFDWMVQTIERRTEQTVETLKARGFTTQQIQDLLLTDSDSSMKSKDEEKGE